MNKEEIADILTTAADFVFLTVDGQGKVLSANPAVRKVFAKQEGEVEGHLLSDLIPDIVTLNQMEFEPVQARGGLESFDKIVIKESDCIYLEALAAIEESGERYNIQVEVGSGSSSGSEIRWIELETSKLLHDNKVIFTIIINNITRRKKNEQEILDLNQSLEQKVLERTAELESRTKQVKKIVNSCGDELKAINDTYQSMKERQMDLMENLESHVTDNVEGLSEAQSQSIKKAVNQQLIKCMNIYSEDQITDQKFLLAIITLNELFSGQTQAQQNLKPGQLSGTSQDEVDDLLSSLGI